MFDWLNSISGFFKAIWQFVWNLIESLIIDYWHLLSFVNKKREVDK